jgi:hypothetical protein
MGLSMVTQTCNLSYSGGRDEDNSGQRPVLAKKKFSRDPISTNKKMGVVSWGCFPPLHRGINRRNMGQASLGKNSRPYLKNN